MSSGNCGHFHTYLQRFMIENRQRISQNNSALSFFPRKVSSKYFLTVNKFGIHFRLQNIPVHYQVQNYAEVQRLPNINTISVPTVAEVQFQ